MPSARGIRAGRAFVELFADDSKLVRGLRRAEKRLKAFGDRIRNFGLKMAGAISAAIAPLGVLTIRAAADAQESLSRFEQVFKDQADAAGAFADALAKSVGRSKYEIRDALATFQSFFVGLGFGGTESRELSQRLQALALDFASFHNITDEDAIQRFIAALSGSGEVLDRFGINIKQAALQQELLRTGIRKSWTEVTEQEKALARLNIITRAMGDQGAVGDAVRTAGSFTNQIKRLRGQVRDTAVEIGQALLPIVTPLVAKVAEAAKWFGQWISRNQQLVATIFKVAAAVFAGAIAIALLGTIISGLSSAMAALIAVVTGVGTVFKLLAGVIAFLLSPIGLVIAAVAALGAYLVVASGMGGKALTWLGEKFGALAEDASAAWQGIGDALATGDISLAAKILWLTLKLEWERGTNFLLGIWETFRANFLNVLDSLVYGGQVLWVEFVHTVQTLWAQLISFLQKTWARFDSWHARAVEGTANWIAKRWAELKGRMDDSVDVEFLKRHIDQQSDDRYAEIDDQEREDLAKADDRRNQAVEDAGDRRLEKLKEIVEKDAANSRKREEEHRKRKEQNESDLQNARAEWEQAIQEARKKRQAKEAEAGPEGLDSADDIIDRANQAIAGIGDLLADQAAKIGAQGTFNAANVLGLQAGGATATDRMANGIDKIERNTRPLRNAQEMSFA
jgi:hypothetical protein